MKRFHNLGSFLVLGMIFAVTSGLSSACASKDSFRLQDASVDSETGAGTDGSGDSDTDADTDADTDTDSDSDTDVYSDTDADSDTDTATQEDETDSDTSAQEDTETQTGEEDNSILKVFILAGQSNMEGRGTVTPDQSQIDKNGGMGTLQYLVNDASQKPTYDHLTTGDGSWIVRDDVWIADLEQSGALSVEGKTTFGPELQFGFVMGDYYENPVLIIKTAWGGKSLAVDFRPPSSGLEVGPYYTLMIERVYEVLGNIKEHVPSYEDQGYEIAGFGWHQGWNDRVSQSYNDEYQFNCVNLINDLREEFDVPGMPFALATTGMHGWSETHPRALSLMAAQLAVPDDERLQNGDVKAVETRGYYRLPENSPAGENQGYHWHWNAETFFLIGNGLGEALITLLSD